jgi:uncharacterized membrane protein
VWLTIYSYTTKIETMNIVLWIIQIVLGGMFTMAGFIKSTKPKEELAPKMPWVNDFSLTQVKVIGVLELLGGIGLIVPWASGILSILTPVAGACLALTMLGAAVYHLPRKEYKGIVINFVLGGLAAFVAYGRF